MKLLRAATLVTADPDSTAARYCAWFDHSLVESGLVADDLACTWGAGGSAGRRYCVCAPASGAPVFLRFVQGTTPDGYRPLRSHGWAAIEICVQDVLAVAERLRGSPFVIIGEPRRLDGLPTIFPMQVKGPDQEIVFLTQIDAAPPGQDLPRAVTSIDRLFIMVLACSDMAASLRWFEKVLRLAPGGSIDLEYGVLSEAFGLPPEHKHRIATLTHGSDVFLEVDQYPPQAASRPCHPGELPPGVAIATLLAPDFAALDADWIVPPQPRDGAIYQGRSAATLRAPDGSLVEIVAGA